MSRPRLAAAVIALAAAALGACGTSVVVDPGGGATTTTTTSGGGWVGAGGATPTTTTSSTTTDDLPTTTTTKPGVGGAGAGGGSGGAGNAGNAGGAGAGPTYGAVMLYTDVERYVVYEDDPDLDLCLFVQLAGLGGGVPSPVQVIPDAFVAEHIGAVQGVGSCLACYPSADAISASDAKGLVVIEGGSPSGATIRCDVAMLFDGAPPWAPAAANLITLPVPVEGCVSP